MLSALRTSVGYQLLDKLMDNFPNFRLSPKFSSPSTRAMYIKRKRSWMLLQSIHEEIAFNFIQSLLHKVWHPGTLERERKTAA